MLYTENFLKYKRDKEGQGDFIDYKQLKKMEHDLSSNGKCYLVFSFIHSLPFKITYRHCSRMLIFLLKLKYIGVVHQC